MNNIKNALLTRTKKMIKEYKSIYMNSSILMILKKFVSECIKDMYVKKKQRSNAHGGMCIKKKQKKVIIICRFIYFHICSLNNYIFLRTSIQKKLCLNMCFNLMSTNNPQH